MELTYCPINMSDRINVSTEHLEWCPNAPMNAGKHVTSHIACVRSQRYTNDLVFWLAQMMLCVMKLHNFLLYVGESTPALAME